LRIELSGVEGCGKGFGPEGIGEGIMEEYGIYYRMEGCNK
jgi:hypothetical protein